MLCLTAVAVAQGEETAPDPIREVGWRLNKLAEIAGLWTLIGVILVIKIAKVSAVLLISLFSPASAFAARERIARSPWRMLVLGLINAVALLLILAILPDVPIIRAVKLLLIMFAMFLVLVGMSGLYANIGERLLVNPQSENKSLLAGGATWEAAILFPFLGQLAQIIGVLITLGAGVQVLWTRKKKEPQAQDPAVLPPNPEQ
ncbi:MAG: hypothetical protein ACOC29_03270 [Candidatus Sumerlaeota bacterium]